MTPERKGQPKYEPWASPMSRYGPYGIRYQDGLLVWRVWPELMPTWIKACARAVELNAYEGVHPN